VAKPTTNDLPLACSLGAGDRDARLKDLTEIGRRLLSLTRRAGAPVLLRFSRDPDTKAELERIVAAEAECCAFLDMRITEQDEALQLSIAGPQGSEPIVEELMEAIAGAGARG